MRRRRSGTGWIPAALVFAVALFFLFPKAGDRPLSLVEAPFVWAAGQLTRAGQGAAIWLDDTWADYRARQQAVVENRRLRDVNQRLLTTINAQREALRETDRLAGLLDLRARYTEPTLAARVIGADATRWLRSVVLDQGSADGVRVGDGVVAADGVVGRVVTVTPHTAQVLMVTNRGSVVPARIQRTRESGIIEGGAQVPTGLDLALVDPDQIHRLGLAELKFMYRSAELQPGDAVVTSGLSGRFPPGVPIGSVVGVLRDDSDPALQVFVLPHIRFDTLEAVLVMASGMADAATRDQPTPDTAPDVDVPSERDTAGDAPGNSVEEPAQ